MKIEFGTYLTKYFGDYLPNQRGVSSNTIKSYRDTFIQLIDFMKAEYSIQCNKLNITDFTTKRIYAFLSYIELKRKISHRETSAFLLYIRSFAICNGRSLPAMNFAKLFCLLNSRKRPLYRFIT